MMRLVCGLLVGLLPLGAQNWLREYRGAGGTTVYVRVTCKKGLDGYPGLAGQVEYHVYSFYGQLIADHRLSIGHCPTMDDVRSGAQRAHLELRPVLRQAQVSLPPSPSDGRMFVADATGKNGRREIFSLDTRTRQATAPIDTGDRPFGGLALAPDGSRLYAALGAYTLGPGPVEPAYIAYIDPATNTIIDRVTMPGVTLMGKPDVSPDGRYLYFPARTDGGRGQLYVLEVAAKTIAGPLPPAPFNPSFSALAVSPDGAMVCATETLGLFCWDTRTRTYLGHGNGGAVNLRPVFHPDGSRIYEYANASVWVIDATTFAQVARIQLPLAPADVRTSLTSLSISPDGLRLFVDEGFTGTLNIIDTRTNQIVRTVQGLTTGSLGAGFIQP